MSDGQGEDGGKLTLKNPVGGSLGPKKTVEAGRVRQSLSPRRSKTVTVEVRRRRVLNETRTGAGRKTGSSAPSSDGLSEAERRKRMAALAGAARTEEHLKGAMEESSRRATEALRQREEEEERQVAATQAKAEAAAGSTESAEPDAASTKLTATEPVAPTKEAAPAARPATRASARPTRADDENKEDEGPRPASKTGRSDRDKVGDRKAAAPRAKSEPRRRQGKLTIHDALTNVDDAPRGRSLAALRRAREKERQQAQALRDRKEKVIRDVIVPETLTVAELANRMAERTGDVIKSLMKLGVMVTANQSIDADTAELVIGEFGHRFRRVAESDVEIGLGGVVDDPTSLQRRAPVVAVMGHVDHGKTSLLDALRETDVRSRESGGITQHIGAYQVSLPSGAAITFLDTPGHEAFTQMRKRGAMVTDIVVLVVAADDGVQPQTIEAINHARAANTPIIVAVNKCDKPDAQPDKIKKQLLKESLVAEELGGDVQFIPISALKRQNLDKLEEAILLQAELMELSANPDRRAVGVVIEARLEKGRGPVVTVLVQQGRFQVGDIFVAGAEWGRVRTLLNDAGQPIDEAGPSTPVEITGAQGTPQAGDEFLVLDNEARAREVASYRQRKVREASHAVSVRDGGSMEKMFERIKTGEGVELPVVVKADVQGSLEAITSALEGLILADARVRVLHGAVGGITESDVNLASSVHGIVMGFNVRPNPQARELAHRDSTDIRFYSVIYDLIDDAKKSLSGMLAPELKERLLGYAEVREVFTVSKTGQVAGCYVTEGLMRRGARARILQDNVVTYEGALRTLRRFKEDVPEVRNGYECGVGFENYNGVKVGDIIECFDVEEIQRVF